MSVWQGGPDPARRQQVTPEWERLTAHIEADPESKAKLGCVRPVP